jgi:hypothetical protein
MGLIEKGLDIVFGDGRNMIRDTAEVFRENAEQGAVREAARAEAALAQFGAEFIRPTVSWFDRIMDGVNRLPRPMLALGTLGLFVAAMVDPLWFAERMQGIALVPEPLWWLMGAVVSFYFGARHQAKGQEFQASVVRVLTQAPAVIDNIAALRQLGATSPGVADTGRDAGLAASVARPAENPALEAWRQTRAQTRPQTRPNARPDPATRPDFGPDLR